jgi:serine/threonine protein kinase
MKSIARPGNSYADKEGAAAIKQEISILKRLHHENIVKLVEVIDDPSSRKIYLIQGKPQSM